MLEQKNSVFEQNSKYADSNKYTDNNVEDFISLDDIEKIRDMFSQYLDNTSIITKENFLMFLKVMGCVTVDNEVKHGFSDVVRYDEKTNQFLVINSPKYWTEDVARMNVFKFYRLISSNTFVNT